MILIERIARVLAGRHYSRNGLGEAHAESAAAIVDAQWPDFVDDAVAVLKTLRDPGEVLPDAAHAGWHDAIEAALTQRSPVRA